MAKPAMDEHSRWLAGEAGRRGWQYCPSGDHLRLTRRWNWHCRFEHPFELQAQSKPGLSRYDRIGDLICGVAPDGPRSSAGGFGSGLVEDGGDPAGGPAQGQVAERGGHVDEGVVAFGPDVQFGVAAG